MTEDAFREAQRALEMELGALVRRLGTRSPNVRAYVESHAKSPIFVVATYAVVVLPSSAMRDAGADHLVVAIEVTRGRNGLRMTAELSDDPGPMLRGIEPVLVPLGADAGAVALALNRFVDDATSFVRDLDDHIAVRVHRR